MTRRGFTVAGCGAWQNGKYKLDVHLVMEEKREGRPRTPLRRGLVSEIVAIIRG